MWLRRWVGAFMIITLLGMNTLVVSGLVAKPKKKIVYVEPAVAAVVPVPTVTLAIDPSTVPAQTTSALTWTTTGNPACTATGAWSGVKTPNGAESTGRLPTPGNFTYTLTCTNDGGTVEAAATVTVGDAIAPKKSVVTTNKPSGGGGATYCGGRAPCYGPKDIASHGSAGNCWGYNGDRVINVGSFDTAYHQTKSGISSIQIAGVCGSDLSKSLNDQVKAEGQSRNHNQSTKANLDQNVTPYFIGYYDAAK